MSNCFLAFFLLPIACHGSQTQRLKAAKDIESSLHSSIAALGCSFCLNGPSTPKQSLATLILQTDMAAWASLHVASRMAKTQRSAAVLLSGSRTPEERAQKVISNIMDGEVGRRGELWFFGQLGILAVFALAPSLNLGATALYSPTQLELLQSAPVNAFGTLLFFAGVALAVGSALQLGDSLSPWPKPVADNELKTDGLFGVCRHPIYAGLVFLCFGLAMATQSPERLLLSLGLFVLLDYKARGEEEQLQILHGDSYEKWEKRVPRFFPNVKALEEEISRIIKSFSGENER